jgi:hypothetical protein
MSLGWWLFGICIASGVIFEFKGLALPLLAAPGWWIYQGISGAFVNRSANGDNLSAEVLLAAIVWLVIGIVGVMLGLGLRIIARWIGGLASGA